MKKLAILVVVAVVALVGLVSYSGRENVSEPKNNGQILAELKTKTGGGEVINPTGKRRLE